MRDYAALVASITETHDRAQRQAAQAVNVALTLRNWRPGDQYQPAGSNQEQKLKILFQKARIPQWERGGWPVYSVPASSVVLMPPLASVSIHPSVLAGAHPQS